MSVVEAICASQSAYARQLIGSDRYLDNCRFCQFRCQIEATKTIDEAALSAGVG